MYQLYCRLAVFVSVLFAQGQLGAKEIDNAVILLYHHVSTQTPAVTSVTPEVFRQHLAYLSKHHTVLPLTKVIQALKQKQALPDKTVVITFDDGYDNIFQNAHPLLREYNFPYTVFINPPLIGNAGYQMDWSQVKQMANEGATFANHGNKHDHMLTRLANENQQQWLDRVVVDVEQAEASLSDQLGYSLKYFAYPYGEYNLPLKQALLARGYTGFAQISGAVASYSDFGALPRYPAAGFYSKIDSLRVKLNSLAMPVLSVSPQEPELTLTTPAFTFTLNLQQDDLHLSQVNCFVSDQPIPLQQEGQSLSLSFAPKQVAGRQRINCTAPSIREKGRYYWFSQPWFTPQADGQWRD